METLKKLGDNSVVLGIKSYIIMNLGSLLSYIVLGIAVALLLKIGVIQNTPFLKTFDRYILFIGIWVAFLLCILIPKGNRPLLEALKEKSILKIVAGIALGFGMNAFCILCAYLHGDIQLTYSQFPIVSLILMFIAVCVQSSAEELVCRCYLLQRILKNHKNPVYAIVFSSLFFAALHLMNPGFTVLSFLNITLSGLLFAIIAYYFNSFWCAAMVHTMWNFTQNIIFGLPNSGQTVPFSIFTLNSGAHNSFFYNVGFGVEGSIIADIVLAVVIVTLIVWIKKHPQKTVDIWTK